MSVDEAVEGKQEWATPLSKCGQDTTAPAEIGCGWTDQPEQSSLTDRPGSPTPPDRSARCRREKRPSQNVPSVGRDECRIYPDQTPAIYCQQRGFQSWNAVCTSGGSAAPSCWLMNVNKKMDPWFWKAEFLRTPCAFGEWRVFEWVCHRPSTDIKGGRNRSGIGRKWIG